jgi:subtilisin-like proprotein convertase family protein
VDHPRISDLVFHLISPDGTRYLLMENRGGTTTNGAGISVLSTSIVPVNSTGGSAAATNTIDTGKTSGTITISYDMLAIPDRMVVQYQGATIFDSGLVSGTGITNISYGPGSSTLVTIIMNPGGNSDTNTAWHYTVTSTQAKYYYLTFTENTNLTTTPIKFAPPPFVPNLTTNLVAFTNGFEGLVAADYTNGQSFSNWTVISNQVSIVTDPTNAYQGTNFLALANGVVSNTLPTVAGRTYTLSFAYRGPGIVSFWRGEGNANDSVAENNGVTQNINYTAGMVGQAFACDPETFNPVRIRVADNPAFILTNSLSIEGWLRPRGNGYIALCRTDNRSGFDPYVFGMEGNNYCGFQETGSAGVAAFIQTPLVYNQWWHVVGTLDGNSGAMKLYTNGVLAVQITTAIRPLANLIPADDGGIGIGNVHENSGGGFPFFGDIDELSLYSRALSASEIKAIYKAGSVGKFDPAASVPQNLAEAKANLQGNNLVTLSGDNSNWQIYNTTFTATQNGTPLTLAGVEPGMLLDNFTFNNAPGNLYYLPEQSIQPLIGQSAQGTWQLEIQDDRAGAGLTNTLVSWQLEFVFANTNFTPSTVLTNGAGPQTNVVPANSILWFLVTVPGNADIATNDLIFASAPVNLLFNQTAPDTNGDFTLLGNSTGGISILTTSSAPTNIIPGATYFLGIQNTNNFAVTNVIEVDFHLLASASSPFAFTQPAQSVTGTSAQLNGMASPNGLSATAWFEWGTTASYGNQTPPVSVGNSFNVVYVTSQIGGLVMNVPYHFRLVVSNALAVVKGFDQILDEANVVVWGANFAEQKIVPPGLSNVVAIAGAYDHSLALKNNGKAVVWGDNTFNQTNVPAALNTNLVAVAGGESYSLALKNSGTVIAWGANIFPGETNVPAGLNNVVTIASGQYSSLALKNDGSVVGWGANISGLTNVPTALSNAVAIAGGSFHNLGIRNDGIVIAWGDDSVGQTDVPAGLTNVVAVSGGSFHSLALKNDGTVRAWGDDAAGQTDVPVGLTNVVAVAAGGFHSLALKNDGSVVAWGDDSAGQTSVPLGLTNVVAIAGGNLHSLALTPLFKVNSTNPIVLNISPGVPQTNSILSGGIVYYQINVPVNADFATNLLLFADAPLNVWFTTNTPPTTNGATVLIANSTNGISILSTISAPTNIIPGGVYYLGVQNTNSFAVTYGIEVDFHLLTVPPIAISSITQTNIGGKFGFLLKWFAPTNDIFQVQWTPSLSPVNWQTFSNIITYIGPPTPTNGLFTFFDDGSQTGGFGPMRFYRLILLGSTSGLTNGVPQTSSVPANSTDYFSINVPTNADWATNILDFASAPVNLLFNQTTPPNGSNAGDFTLLLNSTGGIGSPILGLGTTPPLIPGSTYYLGVKNTNSFAVNFAIEVDFHLRSSTNPIAPVSISSIVATNIGGKSGFLLKWFAPTNDIFQVQWTDSLAPVNWQTFSNIITYIGPPTPTNGLFTFFDDGSQTPPGLPPIRFYRLLLLQATNTLTLPNQTNDIATVSSLLTVTNTATDSNTNLTLTYSLTSSPVTSAVIDTNGVITWTPDPTNGGGEFKFTTVVTDNGVPSLRATNSFTVFVVPPFPSISSVSVTATNVTLRWTAPTNDLFQVEWTTSLTPVIVWTPFPGIITSTSGLFTFTDTNAPLAMKFYRLDWLPLP